MLAFAGKVRKSMLSSRRTQPLPQDFISALAHDATRSSELLPHTTVRIPQTFALPLVLGPPPSEPPPPSLDLILGESLNGQNERAERRYIPKHFPSLPSRHTWQATPIYAARETDPRKQRELAMEEGVLAEQALRKLANARKSQPVHRSSQSGTSQMRTEEQKKKVWEEALAAVLQEDANEQRRHEERLVAEEEAMDELFEVKEQRPVEPKDIEMGMLVNYDRKNWRKAPIGRTAYA